MKTAKERITSLLTVMGISAEGAENLVNELHEAGRQAEQDRLEQLPHEACRDGHNEFYLKWSKEPRFDLPKAMVISCSGCGKRIDSFNLDQLLPELLKYAGSIVINVRD